MGDPKAVSVTVRESKTKILIVDDEASQREMLGGFLEKRGFRVSLAESGEAALEQYRDVFSPIAIVDMKMPGMTGIELLGRLREINPFIQVIVLTAFGSVETAVEAMQAGAYDYLTKPIEDLDELLVRLEKAVERNRLVVDNRVMAEALADRFGGGEILGESEAMQHVREMITRVASGDATVLVTGPSGTGKELAARAIHALSGRSQKSLVAINCAAFPETLLEAELFGYERGAFTGADRAKQGRFELAEGGTLFLDEIGELPVTMQVKLLRVLEDRRIERLGSVKQIQLDTRIIAATNRDLDAMIAAGTFREDLYYRLNVIRIDMPPLNARGGDILLLAEEFIRRHSRRIGRPVKGVDAEAARILSNYRWPGNVRELENVIERAIVLTKSEYLTVDDLPGLETVDSTSSEGAVRPMADVEREHIKLCLDRLGWNLGQTADILGIHRNTLRVKIKEYGLKQG